MLHLKEVAYEDNLLETYKHWTVEGAGKLRVPVRPWLLSATTTMGIIG